jgi:hypothetical protein
MNAQKLARSETQAAPISMPRLLLHLEGAAVLLTAVILYGRFTGASWWLFALLLLVPDAAMLPYLVSARAGAISYNLVHTYTTPLLLGVISVLVGWQVGVVLALILLAHNGMDRLFGYGLKYPTRFKDTHLGRL